jgi:hypothetical protein
MRRAHLFRWLGVALVVAVGLYFVFDVVALQYMQGRGSADIAQTLAAEGATLKLGSIPFLPRYLSGHLGSRCDSAQCTRNIEAKVKGATAEDGFGVQLIDFEASGATFAPAKTFGIARHLFSARTKMTLTDPIVLTEIGQADLSDYIKKKISQVGDVQVNASGIEVRFKLSAPEAPTPYYGYGPTPSPTPTPGPDQLLSKPARYLPRVDAGRFGLTLTSVSQVPPEFRDDASRIETLIHLPPVPAGMTSDVRLGKAVITIESQGKSVTINVGQGPS